MEIGSGAGRSEVVAMSDWDDDCIHWHGRVLTGGYKHWCYDWDDLPIDDTLEEFSYCTCPKESEAGDA